MSYQQAKQYLQFNRLPKHDSISSRQLRLKINLVKKTIFTFKTEADSR